MKPYMPRARRRVLPLILLFVLPGALAADGLREQTERLRDDGAAVVADTPLYSGRVLAEFYAARDHRNAWNAARARGMLDLAESSRADALEPSDFHAAAIRTLLDNGDLDSSDEAVRTRADILLSDALLRYLHHLQYGKYNPSHINRGQNFVAPADADVLKSEMEAAVAAEDLAAAVRQMLPRAPFYDHLKRGYQRYLAIADRGGWQDIPGGVNLTQGMRDPRVPLIRERLAVSDGYEGKADTAPELYDAALAEAVKGFQGRSGLAPDGVIGPNTLRALNHSLPERLAIIRANLERMRWLYHDLPPDYVFVDVAAFRLEVVRDYRPVWSTRTVVGKVSDQTPMFRDEMEHIVFNPTWSVPQSIQKEMGRVSSKYQVIDRRTGRRAGVSDVSNVARYRVVQPAGPGNALGRVKFMFPNGHAIYLHDTPSRHLFARSNRAYSHGCIRVQEPLTLARQILDRPNWDAAEIDRVVRRGRTRYVHLDDHLQVLIYYLTAMADDQGRVGFRRDIYGRDQRLLAALEQPADAARIAFREPEAPAVAADGAPADDAGPAADGAAVRSDASARSARAQPGDEPSPTADAAGTVAGAASKPSPPASAPRTAETDDGNGTTSAAGAEGAAASPSGDGEPAGTPTATTAGSGPPAASAPLDSTPAAADTAAEIEPAADQQPVVAGESGPGAEAPAADAAPAPVSRTMPAVSGQTAERVRAPSAESDAPRRSVPSRPFLDQELFGPPSG